MKQITQVIVVVLLLMLSTTIVLAQDSAVFDDVTVTMNNTFQSEELSAGVETPFGEPLTATLTDGIAIDFLYTFTFTGSTLTMVPGTQIEGFARVLEPGFFDRYYLTFDQPILAGAVSNPEATLVPNVTVLSATELVVEIGEGMEIGPGFEAEIKFTLADVESSVRESGATVTMMDLGDLTVHTYSAPEEAFFNSTHIIESANSLVLIDPQFFMPFAMDFRAYADSLGKPIERVLVSHAHPDHYAGLAAFADVTTYALPQTIATIEAVGAATLEERRAMMGDVITDTLVVPANAIEPGEAVIDGVNYIFDVVADSEADFILTVALPDYGVLVIQDIAYSGIHLILAGNPVTWIEALSVLQGNSYAYPVVLTGHGLPTTPNVYQVNINWLLKAGELLATAENADAFKSGLMEAFPDLGMEASIDFALPFLFPADGT